MPVFTVFTVKCKDVREIAVVRIMVILLNSRVYVLMRKAAMHASLAAT
jgi:hypothetical protein